MKFLVGSVVLILAGISNFSVESNQTFQYHYVCPKNFKSIGRQCYHFSNTTATWFQAFFSCNDIAGSNLTIFREKFDQRQLENFLFRNWTKNRGQSLTSFWVGGFKDWKQKKWIYPDGSFVKYPPLKDIDLSQEDDWTCLLIDSKRKRWRAENCMERRPYICETKVLASVVLTVDDKKTKKKITIDDCIINTDLLTKKQQRRCWKMLGGRKGNNENPNNEPAAVIQKPVAAAYPTQPTIYKPISYICPQNWMSIGKQCYLFSKEKGTWSEAHFNCGQINARLVIIRTKAQDQKLRIFLNGFTEKQGRWIGGRYNRKKKEWIWALNGKILKYRGFAKESLANDSVDKEWQAILMDPQYSYQWSFRNEMEKHHYICQVKAKTVRKINFPKTPAATIEILPDQKYQRKNQENRGRSSRRANRNRRT